MIEFTKTIYSKLADAEIVELLDDKDFYSMIDAAVKSDVLCKSCAGLRQCTSENVGFQYVLEMSLNGRISPSYVLCRHKEIDMQNKQIQKLLLSSRMPELFKEKTFDNFRSSDNPNAYMAAQKVANDANGKGLMLCGNPGTGKTHLAAAIMNVRMQQGLSAIFVTVPELMADIRNSFGKGNQTSELIKIIENADLLVLDDLGTERITDWVIEQLFSLINYRCLHKKQTIITSNYEPKELIIRMAICDKRTGDIVDDVPGIRIVSRLNEMCYIVKAQGRDQRIGA